MNPHVNRRLITSALLVSLLCVGPAGCESAGRAGNSIIGAAIGAAGTAAAVKLGGGDDDEVIAAAIAGGVVGAAVGYVIGDNFEKRQARQAERDRAEQIYAEQVARGAARAKEQAQQTPPPDQPAETASEQEVEELGRETVNALVAEAAKANTSENGGRVAVEVDRTESESTFVLVDPLTGEADTTAYTLTADEARRYRESGETFAQMDGYTVLVAGAGDSGPT